MPRRNRGRELARIAKGMVGRDHPDFARRDKLKRHRGEHYLKTRKHAQEEKTAKVLSTPAVSIDPRTAVF